MYRYTRRLFIEGCASLGAIAGGRMFAAPSAVLKKPHLKFGVISDVHGRDDKQSDSKTLKRALAYFRDNGADAVLIAGDIADQGYADQLKYAADAWYSVFPDDKAPDGRHVEKLFVYGNHDVDAWKWGRKKEELEDPALRERAIGVTPEKAARVWEDCFREKFEPIWIKDVKGYKFVGCHWGHFQELGAFLESHAAELKGEKPFFYTQHPHPKGTCIGTWAWGHDNGDSTRALSAFPNCVAFSGHSHYTLTDERTVWQGAFTSLNTSSLRYSSRDYNFRENASGNPNGGYKRWKPSGDDPRVGTGDGRQGMLVEVGDGVLVIHRREFVWGESLGDDWVVPMPAAVGGPLDFAKRAAERKAPEFDGAARVKAAEADGKDGTKYVVVSFPAAKSVDGCRVFEYEISVAILEDDVDMPVMTRRILAPDFHLPESKSGLSGVCRFRLSDLPQKAAIRFEVRPLECFGKKGFPIASAVFRT